MKDCNEDGKLINSSSSSNSKEDEKISTNSLDLHQKDDTKTKDSISKIDRKRKEICNKIIEQHEMLKYLQSNIDECETTLTYYSVKKDLVSRFGQETFDQYKVEVQALLAATAEEAALVLRNEDSNEKWNSLLLKNSRDNKIYGKIMFGSPNSIPRKDVLDVNMDESVTEFSLPRSTNKSNTTDENIEEIAEGGLWIWGQVFDALETDTQLATRPRQHVLDFDVAEVACSWQITSCYYLTHKGDIYYSGTDDNSGDNIDEPGERPRILRTLAMERALSKSSRITKVCCGSHFTLALTSDGRVYSWGDGSQGCLGHGSFSDEKEPRQCVALFEKNPITQISTGSSHSVFLSTDNNVYTCGEGNDGRLGLGDTDSRSIPTKVDLEIGAILSISCGWDFTMIVAIEGPESKKGRNIFSQFFSSTKVTSVQAVDNSSIASEQNGNADGESNEVVGGDSKTKKDISGSRKSTRKSFSLSAPAAMMNRKSRQASDKRGTSVYAFGNGKSGQCGSGERRDELYPYVIPKLKGKDVIDVSSGHAHSAALCANGDLYCWGDGDCGQTGTQNILELLPQKVDLYNIMPSLDKVVTIGCGPFHTVVGTKFGHVYSWGQNSVGALGIGDNVAGRVGTPSQVFFPCTSGNANYQKDASIMHLTAKLPGKFNIYCGFNTTFVKCVENSSGRDNAKIRRDSETATNDSKADKIKVEKLRNLRQRWQNQIIPQWHTISAERWVVKLIRAGIPFQIRQTAWPRIIGNIVKVTPKMYEITVSHAKKLNDMTDDSEIEKIENASLKLISADLARTFPSLDLFGEGGVWTAPLRECLEAFALHRPDLGYVQGMSYIAAMLLLHIPNKYITFQCLVNLMVKDHLFVFYMLNGELIEQYLKIFDLALEKNMSSVASRLKELDISADMYLFPWIQTVFLKYTPLSLASRIWDNFLLDGVEFLFRTSLAILNLFSKELLSRPMEECMKLLQKHTTFKDVWRKLITEDDLFRAIERVSIPQKLSQLLSQICNDVYKFL
eukprot:g2406.t1